MSASESSEPRNLECERFDVVVWLPWLERAGDVEVDLQEESFPDIGLHIRKTGCSPEASLRAVHLVSPTLEQLRSPQGSGAAFYVVHIEVDYVLSLRIAADASVGLLPPERLRLDAKGKCLRIQVGAACVGASRGSPDQPLARASVKGPVQVLLFDWLPAAVPLQLAAYPFTASGRVGGRLWPCAALLTGWLRRCADGASAGLDLDLDGLLLDGDDDDDDDDDNNSNKKKSSDSKNSESRNRRSSDGEAQGTSTLKAIELGCGTGVCSMVCAAHLALTQYRRLEVLATDDDSRVFPMLRQNISLFEKRHEDRGAAGAVTLKALPLDFSQLLAVREVKELSGPFQLVMASDVVYEHRLLEPLLAAFAELLSPSVKEKSLRRAPTALGLLAIELRPCGLDLQTALPRLARTHGLIEADVTEEALPFAPKAHPALHVPELDPTRHRLYELRPADFR